jgi:hypothetical protein
MKTWKAFFFPLPVPGPLNLNRLCSNNSAFWVDRGVSEGFSVDSNWQDTGPGEEKVHQLFKTNCNRWNFRWLLKDVQQSIIQLYLQKVTL